VTRSILELALIERAIGELIVTLAMLETVIPHSIVHSSVGELARSLAVILGSMEVALERVAIERAMRSLPLVDAERATPSRATRGGELLRTARSHAVLELDLASRAGGERVGHIAVRLAVYEVARQRGAVGEREGALAVELTIGDLAVVRATVREHLGLHHLRLLLLR